MSNDCVSLVEDLVDTATTFGSVSLIKELVPDWNIKVRAPSLAQPSRQRAHVYRREDYLRQARRV